MLSRTSTLEDVRRYFNQQGLVEIAEIFYDQAIDGEVLYGLSDEELSNLIPKFGWLCKVR